MTKAASTMTFLLLWVLGAGCASQSTPARVHLRVFEVPTEVMRQHTSARRPYKLSDSDYAVSIVTPDELNAMLHADSTSPRLLADQTRVINDWPAVTDTWVYMPSYAGMGIDSICTGGGVGYVGVRENDGHLDLHLDYIVNHRGPQGQKLIESKILYDHPYPEGGILLFHAPLDVLNGVPQQHVIAFEVTRAESAPAYGNTSLPSQPGNILGYQ